MDLDSGAGLLHRLTSYAPGRDWDVPVDDPRIRQDLTPNDPATLPPPVKQYAAGPPVTPLPRQMEILRVPGVHQVEAPAREPDALPSGAFRPYPVIDLFMRQQLRTWVDATRITQITHPLPRFHTFACAARQLILRSV